LAQSNDEKKVVDSFKSYVQHHLDSYKTNRRERVLLFPDVGWVHQYYEVDAGSAKIDMQRTNSPLAPYTGTLEFRLIRHYTAFHASREEATVDTDFEKSDVNLHHHTYAYQDQEWIPKTRRFRNPEIDLAEARYWTIHNGKPETAADHIVWTECTDPPGGRNTQR
jgi:hypothetical protein